MNEIRIMIAEDHKTVRSGMKLLIESEPDMSIAGEAEDGSEAVEIAEKVRPDVLVMDISMPNLNGLEATRKIKKIMPAVKVVILTRHTDAAFLQELLQAGVSAYVLKQSESEELLKAIRAAARGENYLDPAITGNIFHIFSSNQNKNQKAFQGEALSERESEVLRLIARGYSNKEIATQFKVSVKTVESQKSIAMRKLNLTGRNEIVDYAILQGWLKET